MRQLILPIGFAFTFLASMSVAQADYVDEEDLVGDASLEALGATAAQAGPKLDTFLTVVKNTLRKVNLDKDQPPLKNVSVQLKTTAVRNTGGNFSIFVLSFNFSNANTSEVTLKINLSGQLGGEGAAAEAAAATPPPVSTRLARTIESAYASLKDAGFDKDSKPLSSSGLTLTQKFAVTRVRGGGVGGTFNWTMVPITLGLTAGRTKGHEQVIVFEFAKPPPKPKPK